MAKKKAEVIPIEDETLDPEFADRLNFVRQRIKELIGFVGEHIYELGKHLYETYHGEYFKEWGYASFEEYCEVEMAYSLWKAREYIGIWETFDQRLKIPWEVENDKEALQLSTVPWTKLRVITSVVDNKKEARKWLKTAQKRSRKELEELVRQEKARRRPQESGGRGRKIEDVDVAEGVEDAANSKTPFVEDIQADADMLTDLAEEIDDEDEETGEVARLIRLTFIVDRDEQSHILAAFERLAQITGEKHPGKLLDLMAGEVNETLADNEAGGAVHRLEWYVQNLERIFEVKIEVEVPRNSRLRKMSRDTDDATKTEPKKKSKKRA